MALALRHLRCTAVASWIVAGAPRLSPPPSLWVAPLYTFASYPRASPYAASGRLQPCQASRAASSKARSKVGSDGTSSQPAAVPASPSKRRRVSKASATEQVAVVTGLASLPGPPLPVPEDAGEGPSTRGRQPRALAPTAPTGAGAAPACSSAAAADVAAGLASSSEPAPSPATSAPGADSPVTRFVLVTIDPDTQGAIAVTTWDAPGAEVRGSTAASNTDTSAASAGGRGGSSSGDNGNGAGAFPDLDVASVSMSVYDMPCLKARLKKVNKRSGKRVERR